jgi:pyrophosphatase PpaX
MKYRAVIFDLDDTLLDSFDARVKALEQVFARAGVPQPRAEQFLRALQGTQLKDALTQLESNLKTGANLFEDYRRNYWTKETGTINLFPGVKLMLEELHSRGIKLGIVTNKGRKLEVEGCRVGALPELEELGIADLFSVVVGFEDVSWTKPHPQGINIALAQLMVPPEKTLLVGDSAADMIAAGAAGCRTCYATWGLPPEDKLKDIRADHIVDTPDILCRLVLRRFDD